MKDTELFNVEDDYIKISDLIMMLWRHKYPIIAFTLIVTLVVGLVLFAQPRKFEASVVMRSTGAEDVIQSHLVIGKSSLVAKRVHEELAGTGSDYPLYKLMNAVTVSRSGKTDVLNCRAVTLSPEDSRAIAELWSSEMIKESRSKSEERALNYVRNKIKADEEELVRGLAVLEGVKRSVEQLESDKFFTLSKSFEDVLLQQELLKGIDEATIKRLSELKLNWEQVNPVYVNALERRTREEENVAATLIRRDFYTKAEAFLDAKLSKQNPDDIDAVGEISVEVDESIERFVESLLQEGDLTAVDEPVVRPVGRGSAKKLVLVLFASCFVSCLAALGYEWLRSSQSSYAK